MIENLQNEHKQAKGAKLCVNIRSWRAKFFEVLERQNMKNQTIFELYTTDDNKSKYSNNPMNILKSAKKKQKKNMKLYTKCTSTLTVQSLPL